MLPESAVWAHPPTTNQKGIKTGRAILTNRWAVRARRMVIKSLVLAITAPAHLPARFSNSAKYDLTMDASLGSVANFKYWRSWAASFVGSPLAS